MTSGVKVWDASSRVAKQNFVRLARLFLLLLTPQAPPLLLPVLHSHFRGKYWYSGIEAV